VHVPAIVLEIGHREGSAVALGACVVHPHQSIGIFERQVTKQRGIDEAEHERRRADSRRQREHTEQREARTPSQEPAGLAKVEREIAHSGSPAPVDVDFIASLD
jgi:hypothetical protein